MYSFYRHRKLKHIKVEVTFQMSFRTSVRGIGYTRYTSIEFRFIKPKDKEKYHTLSNGVTIVLRNKYKMEASRFYKNFEVDKAAEILYGKRS